MTGLAVAPAKRSRVAVGLPDLIVIGAMKCGTTTLYRYLAQHPEIDMSRDKETDFFIAEKNWDLGLDWYGQQFQGEGRFRGEASPNYTKSRDFPGVAARMAGLCPQARLVYILRDPVTRAESQYRHGVIVGDWPPTGLQPGTRAYGHILDGSRYAHQLDGYLAHYPAEAILVLDFDALVARPQAVMDQVYAHLGAPPHRIAALGAQNDSVELAKVPAPVLRFAQTQTGRRIARLVGRGVRDRIRGTLARGPARAPAPFSDALRARLAADLAEDTARLRRMTGQAFAHWSV